MSRKNVELFSPIDENRIKCTACARYCRLGRDQVGFCGMRRNVGNKLSLLVYGRVLASHIDPIEKKPVSHYRPGTRIFSIGTTGCNFICRYCDNYDLSQRREIAGVEVGPKELASLAKTQNCHGIAYTYNEPTIFLEFARDAGVEAHALGLFNIFVSNGFGTPEGVRVMREFLDCITVDFKGNADPEFVRKYIGIPDAEPIFQTLLDIKKNTRTHIEITDLVIPGVGDDLSRARKLSRWIYDNLGPDVPVHFLRFFPSYRMQNLPETPLKTLESHWKVAKESGLNYVYLGNVPGHRLEHTYCPSCNTIAVERRGFEITDWHLDRSNRCRSCGQKIAIDGTLSESAHEQRFLPADLF